MRVLVVGDAILDRYWFGDITRISPEAPVPVVQIGEEKESIGGAANVARNIEAMGIEVRTLYSESFFTDPVVKLRVISRNQQTIRIDFDRPQKPLLPEIVEREAKDCDIVVLSDYAKGSLAMSPAIIWKLKQAGKKVFVDPKNRDYGRYAGADVLKPNLNEIREMLGGWASEEELEHKVKRMQRQAKIEAVLLTRGQDGMTLFNGSVTKIECASKEVFDVTGAGDTAIAAFTAAVARGKSMVEAAYLANKASGIAVGRFGTAVVGWQEFCE
jgi:rfaE bifunctional protein kinase chain/domain